MQINVNLDSAKINNLINAQKKALEMATEAVKTDIMTSGVTPKKTGELERSCFVDDSDIEKGKCSLAYSAAYASRLYFHPEYDFRADINSNAQGKWLDTYLTGEKKDFAKDAYKKFLKDQSGVIK